MAPPDIAFHSAGQPGRRLSSAAFSPETYARQAFGIVGGEEPIKVRFLFEPKLAVYITERQWHPSQEFRTRADGRVEMRLETTGRKELVRALTASWASVEMATGWGIKA
jgi:hypothetical protein